MPSAEWNKIKSLFSRAIELSVTERDELLAGESEFVRAELAALIASHERVDEFIGVPAAVEFGLDPNSMVGRVIGSYKLVALIGAGGMGTVFRAEKEDFGKNFALKLIKRGMDTDAVLRRFELERKILARLEHPNIARLLDGGTTTDGVPYFVMEYVEGVSLARFCDEHRYDIRERLELFRRICAAVAYAHQNLVVHRDLKPSNILVTNDGTPKLLDFGIAKLLTTDDFENTATATLGRMFTPEYASPEQLSGQPVTTASDVFSLGVVLYELLCGQRPFKPNSRNQSEISKAIETEQPIRPSAVGKNGFRAAATGDVDKTGLATPQMTGGDGRPTNPKAVAGDLKSLAGDLDNIVLKALRREPERRYQSVPEFEDDIDRFLNGLPVRATPDRTFYRLSKFIGRHRRGVFSGGLAVVLLFAVSGVAAWFGIAAMRERQKAERRLIELREVAKSLVNDTNDSLSKIPGNVVIRKALAERSVALLDSLANDETSDVQLLTDLADAYLKLADLQNWSFREFDKALGNIEKASAIQQRILSKDPANIVLRKQIYSAQMRQIEALHNTNRRDEMFKVATDAVENRRELIRLDPDNPSNYANLAALHGWFGDKNLLFGRKTEAVNSYRDGVEIVNAAIEKQGARLDSADSKAEFARLHFIKGWLLKGAGEPEKAIEFFGRSTAIAKEVFDENVTLPGNLRRVIGGYEEIAWVREDEKDFKGAFDSYSAGIEFLDQALKQPKVPEYGLLLGYKCNYTVSAGKMAGLLGQATESRRLFAAGESLCREMVENDAEDAGVIVQGQSQFFEIAEFYASVGEKDRSLSGLLGISKKLERIYEKNPLDLTAATSLAETYEKLGDLSDGNRDFYRQSIGLWKKISEENSLVPEEIEKMSRAVVKLDSKGTS